MNPNNSSSSHNLQGSSVGNNGHGGSPNSSNGGTGIDNGSAKRPIVLLRGLTREKRHWGEVTELIEKQTGRHVFAPDLPGFGEEEKVIPPHSIHETMEHIRQNVTYSGQQIDVVGLSLGGMVVYDWLLSHPEQIHSFVLINSSFGSCSPFYKRLRWQIYKQIVEIALIQVPRERERKILEIVANSAKRREDVFINWVKIAQDRAWNPVHILKQLAAAALYRPPLEPAKIPGLIVSSLGDRLMDPSCPKAMADKLKLPLVAHPWAGHDIGVDDPQWLVDRLVEFWSGLKS